MNTSTLLRFPLRIGTHPDSTFHVLSFALKESLSTCYTLVIQAQCQDADLAYDSLVGKPAHLTVAGGDFSVVHHGVVTGFDSSPAEPDASEAPKFHYELRIEPRLKLLAYSSRCRVFQKMDVKEIVGEVLAQGRLAASSFAFETEGEIPKREFTVQYNETDLDFLQRLLEDEGIAYFFRHEGDAEKIVFTDRLGSIHPVPETPALPFRPFIGMNQMDQDHIGKMRCRQEMVTGPVRIKNYEHATPDSAILGAGEGAGQGLDYAYHGSPKTQGDADRRAAVKRQAFDCRRKILKGEGVTRALRTGYRFKLEDADQYGLKGEYTVISMAMTGDQTKGFESDAANAILKTEFECIPARVLYRPLAKAVKPKMNGILVARVDGQDDHYASLDEQGRYHVKLPFDLANTERGMASLPVSLAQPYAGPNYGTHFPVHNGNDIVLGFVDGDLDRPIALGALPNPSHSSPVNDRNHKESVIRTASGHELRMSDEDAKTVVDLTTSGEHVLSMNDDPASKEIRIATHGEHEIRMDDTGKKVQVTTKYGHRICLDDGGKTIVIRTRDGHFLELNDAAKSLTLQDAADKTRIHMDGSQGNIEIRASENVVIEAGKKFSLHSGADSEFDAGKNLRLHAGEELGSESGKSTTVQSGKDLMMEAAEKYRIAAKKGSLQMENELESVAKKILASAESAFQVKGGKVNLEAEGKMILKASQVQQN